MRTPVTKDWLPLLLLLLCLLPLKLYGDYWDEYNDELTPEFNSHLEEMYGTGPTKQPTIEKIIRWIIADVDRPLGGDDYCESEILFKSIHYKLNCYAQHYFVAVPYKELQKACHGERVPCNNRRGICRKSTNLVEGVRCVLTSGKTLPDCKYNSFFLTAYPVVTCRWHSENQTFVPETVNNLLLPR
ncbi:inactive ribonuclease-like protein 9 [Nannospalax galili]|uniref:inactive ribonuclease-like protein 9 n=1 Tax=Nannospalax galili TaxID=1026970 RepID=UPI0004ED02E6|nr:inactive ribonuclease-like protein 9 [Nannospalax galili]